MRDLTITLPDRPGVGAQIAEALGRAGINIEGACGFPHGGQTWGTFHLLVADSAAARKAIEEVGYEVTEDRPVKIFDLEDRPGALGEVLRQMADAGANIDLIYMASNSRLIIATDDMRDDRLGVKMTEAKY
ncbi:MAG: ACT domain-containing protein [Actinomycetota bacterium]